MKPELASSRQHGGPDAAGGLLHDFSSNGNACGPCPTALAALQQADATRYPDPQYHQLRERLAQFHGVAPERVVLAASASEFIFRISAAVARQGGRTVRLPAQAYGDYAAAARAWGLQPVSGGAADLVWCCDPSSPLGAPQAGLGAAIDALAADAACVLDLAYEPLRLAGALDLAPAQRDRVWQLWTPNKALGLTGVRAAYALAPLRAQAMVERLEALAPSWPLGAHGVALLQAWTAPEAQAWLAASRATLREWRAQQLAMCEAELGWQCLPGVANFFCARLPVADVAGLCAGLRAQGIKLRDAASFGLPGHVRLAVLSPAAQQALRAAMHTIEP
jgi:histidinol-phosphate aminotransferase